MPGFIDDHILEGHRDIRVRVHHALLQGDSPNFIKQSEKLSQSKFDAIMAEPLPDEISGDLRHLTGQSGAWILQKGKDLLRDEADIPRPMVILLLPHRFSNEVLNAGLRDIRLQLRERGHKDFRFGHIAERTPLYPLLRVSHRQGMPTWEIDAKGKATEYDGRHAALVDCAPVAEATQAETEGPDGP